MRATIKNYVDAAKARREEEGNDKGFSLIELIVVVAILGILVAIAIPVFGAIQDSAKNNAIKTVAANGATSAAAQLANGTAIGAVDLDALEKDGYSLVLAGASIDDICVTASKTGVASAASGPGCP